jgi:hypothetical protein
MKKIPYLLILACLGLILTSCEEEENMQPEGQWELSNPEIILPSVDDIITLDQDTPNETVTISWEPAQSSAGYAVTYDVLVNIAGSTEEETPLFSEPSSNNGNGTSLSINYEELDQALAFGGFSAGSQVDVQISVQANSLSKTSASTIQLKVVRFQNETLPQNLFISGTATENGEDLSQAIALKRLTDSNGTLSNVYEVYTSLDQEGTYKFYSERSLPALQYGGAEGNIEFFGSPIAVENSGQYRILVDLENNTYELLEINFWSMVGTPINGGWGGDEPLEYQGEGIWEASINLIDTGGFAFRANGDWNYLLKRVVGTSNQLVLESDAPDQGLSVEDIPNNQTGLYIVTLDLSADNYTFTFEEDDTVIEPIDTPSQLFLIENGTMIEEFSKDGDVFNSGRFIPMQTDNTYILNTEADGSGISYSINGLLADSLTPDGDAVSGALTIVENNDPIGLASNRGIRFSVDFSAPELVWTYYNFKLFHWQVWDEREEILMTYIHPNTYTVTANLSAGFEIKFISPWDFDLGSDSPNALTGNLINGGGSNIQNIDTNGSYTATITLDDDYQLGTYEFEQE